MTNHILLTGAGFTYNWGGWLTKELEGDLLGRLTSKPLVRTLLQNSENFEQALESLQQGKQRGDADSISNLQIFENAIYESFEAMNLALANMHNLEFTGDPKLPVGESHALVPRFFILHLLANNTGAFTSSTKSSLIMPIGASDSLYSLIPRLQRFRTDATTYQESAVTRSLGMQMYWQTY